MSARVVITGVGLVSSLGDDPQVLHQALCAGLGGLAESSLAAGLPCRLAGEIVGFSAERYLGEGNIRPLDRTGRLVSAAAALALRASGWDAAAREREALGVGLVVGTLFGGARTISEFDRRALTAGPNYVKPLDFANTVISAAAGQAAIWHRLRGPNATIAGGSTAGLQAIDYGADLVRSGMVRAVLAGGAEELSPEALHAFSRAGLISAGAGGLHRPVPCDRRRDGFVLGEGAALVMLEDEASARERGASVLAEIVGAGAAHDAGRGRDEARAADALARAVRATLGDLAPDAVDAVSLSARGSVGLDRAELRGVAAALGPRGAAVPATAIKGALGECLGASGALQVVALLTAMRTGALPGVRGLEALAEDLPMRGLQAAPRELAIRHGLAAALGLDGVAAALLLRACEEGAAT